MKVSNIKEALVFYTKVLDFEVSKEYGPKIVSLVHENMPIVLEEEAVQSESKNVLLGIQSTNIHRDFRQLKEKGVQILSEEPQPCPPGLYFVIEDPSGNQIEILQFIDPRS
ncbi:VOC family protein [Guptibacillus hwajinpoensis]|uniref:VOC family protein n=1 Tax=Guptibacillus hwajinpoensis TaxID=208199 RepID=UPI00384CC910